MKFNEFENYAKNYKIIPVYEKITGDLLTPVLAYLKLRSIGGYSFLLESVEGIGRLARYSFIGRDPKKIIQNNGMKIKINQNGSTKIIDQNIFAYLKHQVESYNHPVIEDLPDFTGGIVGYLGFENVSLIESVINFDGHDEVHNPDSIFGLFNSVIAFDHYKHQLIIIHNAHLDEHDSPESAYSAAKKEITILKNTLAKPIEYKSDFELTDKNIDQWQPEEFFENVKKSKKNIYDGDVFQLVLSKRFKSGYNGDPLNIYRALRIINPSPYMYFMEFGNELTIIGTSPEDLVKVKEKNATILPIAGTRKRGKTPDEDKSLEENLLNDTKEIAEHQMLVDLARNDLGRVCNYDTVRLTEKMSIHRFSHVMHIVSRVEGILREDKNCVDALTASFPAGTVSGAPKIRAIQLINQYEKLKRGVYAGAVGYINFSGNLDMCIAIRTLFAKDNTVYWQAGAGIVADSDPKLELKEINNKSAVLLSALKYAEVIDENTND
ncbi:MAG: anthranilate synthase component I [Ignavibacteriae bacterium HGW-Ignavibacteriae-2]|jgi:anthranilate synthase component 1|nr:MAG: anthranilate synthase component I [Ignavibacteriae bacterium HGW-Ignavibacteriae-2]